jgi:hypothetical protein
MSAQTCRLGHRRGVQDEDQQDGEADEDSGPERGGEEARGWALHVPV